ncbi:hypothetical protein ABWH92_12230 [Ahrensia marina]|uniref:hypothetical protein n=1 Tax=Ahrensia marina TaxID=1514904 RepID=UPI0035D0728F
MKQHKEWWKRARLNGHTSTKVTGLSGGALARPVALTANQMEGGQIMRASQEGKAWGLRTLGVE